MVWLKQKSSLKNCLSWTKAHPMDTAEDESDPSYLYVRHLNKDPTCQTQKPKQTREKEKSNHKEKCCVKKQPLVVVLVLSVFVNIMLVVILAVSVSNHGISQNSGLEVLDSSEDLRSSVCVLCSSLGFNVQDGQVNGRKDIVVLAMSERNTFCCLKNSDHLQKLITVFSAQFRYQENRTSVDTTPVLKTPLQIQHGAHLFLESRFLKKDKLIWTSDLGYGCAYIGHGVRLVGGRIQITEGGTYFIYSFVTLKTRETTSESRNALHTITRYNPSLPQLHNQLLLFRKQSLARESERFATTYLGASLVLRKGDEMFVEVEPVSSVYAFSPSNYFGLFKLDH
ncbi:uncharacterized protein [Haliotis asinina]|uniref:uncharacterized protein n=1 Tax=Haliotis asinina TaxID=109174 RepID=UPI003531D5DD